MVPPEGDATSFCLSDDFDAWFCICCGCMRLRLLWEEKFSSLVAELYMWARFSTSQLGAPDSLRVSSCDMMPPCCCDGFSNAALSVPLILRPLTVEDWARCG